MVVLGQELLLVSRRISLLEDQFDLPAARARAEAYLDEILELGQIGCEEYSSRITLLDHHSMPSIGRPEYMIETCDIPDRGEPQMHQNSSDPFAFT